MTLGSVGLVHMVSPPSSGLFQRVIMQSNPAGFSYTTPGYMAVYGDVRTRADAQAGQPDSLAVHAGVGALRGRRSPAQTDTGSVGR